MLINRVFKLVYTVVFPIVCAFDLPYTFYLLIDFHFFFLSPLAVRTMPKAPLQGTKPHALSTFSVFTVLLYFCWKCNQNILYSNEL